ncbi:MAG: MshQ-like protein [Marinobacter sp.]|nr:MshQ-like protein [Marinobacter sp.]
MGTDWATSITAGTFMPQIDSNRLRMTQASTQQSTSATLQRLIPGAGNYVVLEFDYFAYGGTRADGVAITLSDAAVSPQPGSFGGALGYAQRDDGTPGFAGGWLGIGLDEYGNFPRAAEGRVGGTGTTVAQNVSLRGSGSGLTGYRYITHVGPLSPAVDGTGPVTPHRYRIELNATTGGQALVQVFRNTGSGMTPLIGPVNMLAQAGQAALPEKLMLSITGSTGDLTNVHEFDNLQICALALEEVNEYIDHFELRHPGLGLTCQPTPVDILACLDSECTELYTGEVTATLSPSGWVGGDTVTFSGGMTTALFQRTSLAPGNPVLGVATSSPMVRPLTNNSCRSGGAGPSPALCQLPMVDAGLLVSVPDLVANRPEANAEIRAVRQDDQTQACVPAFENVTKPVRFWSDYVVPGPSGRPVNWPVSVNGAPVGLTAAAQTPVDVSFGTGGVANITVAYADAGRVQLNARYLGSEERGDAGLDMPGVGAQFTSRPVGLCVFADGHCASGDASCPVFRRAGEVFDLTLRAVGWLTDGDTDLCSGNPPTPNFELTGIALSSELVSPLDGVAGSLAPVSYTHQRQLAGETTVAVSQSEVGVFRFRAAPGPYLGGAMAGGLSEPVGRFYPDHFLVVDDPGTLAASCEVTTPFTYTGQPFGWGVRPSLQISARAVGGGLTQNYTQPGYQRLEAAGITRDLPVTDAATQGTDTVLLPVSATLEAGQLTVQGPGLLTYTFSDQDRLWYDKAPVARVQPFTPLLPFSLEAVTDGDGVQALDLPRAMIPDAAFEVRYGRLTMENVFGPETAPVLSMPFRAEFWTGTRYQTHLADGCWQWDSADVEGTANHHTRVAAAGVLVGGEGGPLNLQPAGSTGTDTLSWSVPVWLQDDWDGSGLLTNPSALATFGVFRGHDRIIYWREVAD